jgi:Zn finger protein HypA/HybF involved in hydrogenase expression
MSTSGVDAPTVREGETVFNKDGERLGSIAGFDQRGFRVVFEKNVTVHPEARSSLSGEVELVWRCATCGEVGEIAEIPDECPGCDAPREELYYWIED